MAGLDLVTVLPHRKAMTHEGGDARLPRAALAGGPDFDGVPVFELSLGDMPGWDG
jgi:hypothetical protein